jgi:hypothetical protein
MAGLDPAIHALGLPNWRRKNCQKPLLSRPTSGSFIETARGVGGRVKPGHDSPDASVQQLTLQESIAASDCSSLPLQIVEYSFSQIDG